jgi:hypothetical protein
MVCVYGFFISGGYMPDPNEKEMQGEKEFDSAFEEATKPSGEKDPDKAEAPDKERAEEEVGEPEKEKRPEGQREQERASLEDTADYKKLYEERDQQYNSLQGMYNSTAEELETLKKNPPKAEEKAAEPDVDAILTELGLNDDEEMKAAMGEYDYIVKPILRAVGRSLSKKEQQHLPPEKIAELVQQAVAVDRHFTTIRGTHKDYDDLIKTGRLKGYVDSLPEGPDKNKARGVFEKGTADEVIDLVNHFKGINGRAASDAERSKKITDLTVVKSRQTPISMKGGGGEIAKDDFDGAYEAATRSRK